MQNISMIMFHHFWLRTRAFDKIMSLFISRNLEIHMTNIFYALCNLEIFGDLGHIKTEINVFLLERYYSMSMIPLKKVHFFVSHPMR